MYIRNNPTGSTSGLRIRGLIIPYSGNNKLITRQEPFRSGLCCSKNTSNSWKHFIVSKRQDSYCRSDLFVSWYYYLIKDCILPPSLI